MSLPILRGLLQGYTKSLFDEGTVNDQFNMIMALKRIGKPDSVVQLIETYFADVERILFELLRHVGNRKVDFHKLLSLVRDIESRSTRIGAQHMKVACSDVIKACNENHQQNVSRTLLLLKNEFNNTKSKLTSFIQMEQRIIKLEKSQSPASTSQSSK